MKSVSLETLSNGKLLHVYALKKQARRTSSLSFYFVEMAAISEMNWSIF